MVTFKNNVYYFQTCYMIHQVPLLNTYLGLIIRNLNNIVQWNYGEKSWFGAKFF